MIYIWKGGFPNRSTDAQAVGERCESIRRSMGGKLTPEIIVADAEDSASPMHALFEWNDDIAAREFRLEQARSMLRAIVTTEVAGRHTAPVRAFVAVRQEGDREKSYTSLDVALEDSVLREQVLAAAKSELVAWRARYRELEELSVIFMAIDKQMQLVEQ